jgi:hypothetical protein
LMLKHPANRASKFQGIEAPRFQTKDETCTFRGVQQAPVPNFFLSPPRF